MTVIQFFSCQTCGCLCETKELHREMHQVPPTFKLIEINIPDNDD